MLREPRKTENYIPLLRQEARSFVAIFLAAFRAKIVPLMSSAANAATADGPAITPESITFRPIYMIRVWGGRELERVYDRELPDPDLPYGESWEIADRPEAQSIVNEGRFAGTSLHELWQNHRDEIFGSGFQDHPRFPILIKILDAREDLSVQVHPPRHVADSLGGEPKTEMWYVADCESGARLYAGLGVGITRDAFERAIATGTVADCVHSIEASPGQSIFLPSGRDHAIGGGFLIYEIQQNSDTTYRVFDWDRIGLDGKRRRLHISESLASIDFNDIEPSMNTPDGENLASCEYFQTDKKHISMGKTIGNPGDHFSILLIISGKLEDSEGRNFTKGKCVLLPRNASPLRALADSTLLQVTLPARTSA